MLQEFRTGRALFLDGLRIGVKSIETAFVLPVPTVYPITDQHTAIRCEIDIGRKQVPNVFLVLCDLKRCPFGLQLNSSNAAIGGLPTEVAEEERILQAGTAIQTDSRIANQSRRSVADVGNRRNDVSWRFRTKGIPNLLAIERTTIGQILIHHPPTRITTSHNLCPACFIPRVRIVIASE